MASRPLTRTRIDALKPKDRPYKKSDGGGLHLLVTSNGSKLWRLSYRYGGKQMTLALGAYDATTNNETHARAAREAAKLALADDRDPGRAPHETDGMSTFREVALAWHRKNASGWATKYAALIWARLDADILPRIGNLPIGRVKRSDILAALRPVEERGAIETAHRLKAYIGAVFRYCDDDRVLDPTPMLRDKLERRPPARHFKRLKADQIGAFLVALDASQCEPTTRLAMLLTIYTACRTSEAIGARWQEFEGLRTRRPLWRLPSTRTKGKREHLIQITQPAKRYLLELHALTGGGEFLFPAADGKRGHISNNTMLFHCYAMGYRNKSTMHGWRGSFSTIARESGLWRPEAIETQLGHLTGTKVSRSYDSAAYMDERRRLLAWWADWLNERRDAATRFPSTPDADEIAALIG